MDELRRLIRDIPDFPKPGINFKDLTPLMADATALHDAVEGLAELARPLDVDCVVAAEARGFLLGPALALELGAGFVLARKPGRGGENGTAAVPRIAGIERGHQPAGPFAIEGSDQRALRAFERDEIHGHQAGLGIAIAWLPDTARAPLCRAHQNERIVARFREVHRR